MKTQLRYKPWVMYTLYALGFLCIVGLLSIARGYSKGKKVSAIKIELKGKDKIYFIDEKDIEQRIKKTYPGILEGASISQIDTRTLELGFSMDPWINKAELFFNRQNELVVKVTQTQPIARIVTNLGNHLYIDTNGKWLPLLEKFSPKVPIVTNYPTLKNGSPRNDSLFKASIIEVGKIFEVDSFWQAQLAQLYIEGNSMYLVPTLGSHKVYLGKPTQIADKLVRLKRFYIQYGMVHGLDAYELLNVQYDKQIVATKRGQKADVIKDSLGIRVAMGIVDSTQSLFKPITPIIINDTVDGGDEPIISVNRQSPIVNRVNDARLTPNPQSKPTSAQRGKPPKKPGVVNNRMHTQQHQNNNRH